MFKEISPIFAEFQAAVKDNMNVFWKVSVIQVSNKSSFPNEQYHSISRASKIHARVCQEPL